MIQEALAIVRKHAGPGAKAEVSVVRIGASVEVTVLDDGGAGPDPLPAGGTPAAAGTGVGADGGGDGEEGGGHGLLGMRERATALGGSCFAGPRYGGGYRVHAILPVA
ncbi:hypothetical protein SSAG_05967 [Streptomyces sp. Mg1]|nr:hypothetical protein SSAG_05967 [Streptomyces sp. Mg1]